jgi:glycosyltransferase involved in cell wall biosynthesis
MRDEWEELSHSLNQAAHVRFVGQVSWSEVPEYLLGVDLGFSGQVPLASGTMYFSPLKLYEYMAAARPVVASGFPEARESVKEGITGYLFAPEDKEDLKRALRTAYAQRMEWPAMGARARAEAVEQHGWIARERKAITSLESILEQRLGAAYPSRRGS